MDMPLVKNSCGRILVITIAVFVLFTFSLSSSAQEFAIAGNPPAARVKLQGGDNESLSFNVKYNNKSGITFESSVMDITGEACFHDNNSTGDFEKGIKIPRPTDTDYVIFLIRSATENIRLSYKVKVTA